jgi:hypothetical protein
VAARERDDGKSLPGLLAARFTVRFSGGLYLVFCWRLVFIGDFPGSFLLVWRGQFLFENGLPAIPSLHHMINRSLIPD